MKHWTALITLLPVVFADLMLSVPVASAQNANSGTANIPFSFVAGHHELPAGCYRMKLLSDAILALADCKTSSTVLVMVHTTNGYPEIRYGSMVFLHKNGGYRLNQVRFAATNIESELSVHPARQFAKDITCKSIEIALK